MARAGASLPDGVETRSPINEALVRDKGPVQTPERLRRRAKVAMNSHHHRRVAVSVSGPRDLFPAPTFYPRFQFRAVLLRLPSSLCASRPFTSLRLYRTL